MIDPRKWEFELEAALDVFFNIEKSQDEDALVDIIWQKGILDRLCPKERLVFLARKKNKNTLYEGEGGRNNPDLYYRIIYSIENILYAVKCGHSIDGGYCIPVFTSFYRLYREVKKTGDFKEMLYAFLRRFQAKANEELVRLGCMPIAKPVEIGTRGLFFGVPVSIERFCSHGQICLKADEYEGYCDLYKHLDCGAARPQDIHSANFATQK